MSTFRLEETVRKTIFLRQSLFKKAESIATEEGLSFAEYIRNLLLKDIARREAPAEIPQEGPYPDTAPKGYMGMAPWHVSTKKRAELIKIMHEIRRVLN